MKDKYVIKFWETEADRNQGTPFELLNTPQNLFEAIQEAKKIFDKNNYASVEIQDRENNNNTLYFKDIEEEKYLGEALAYKPFTLQETNFYKYFKEQLDMIIASYDNPTKYGLDRLIKENLDEIIEKLLDDDKFNKSINHDLQQTLEEYANTLSKEELTEEDEDEPEM